MGLSDRERQSLNSIESGLAGCDPELTALLSMFTRLASGEEMPDREKVPAGPAQAGPRLRPARSPSNLRRPRRRVGFQRAALLWLWALLTAAFIAVVLVLSIGGDHGRTCTEPLAMVSCAGPASGHSPDPSLPNATVSQAPHQRTPSIPQTGP